MYAVEQKTLHPADFADPDLCRLMDYRGYFSADIRETITKIGLSMMEFFADDGQCRLFSLDGCGLVCASADCFCFLNSENFARVQENSWRIF